MKRSPWPSVVDISRRVHSRSAPAREPVAYPRGDRGCCKCLFTFGPHPHQSEGMFAWKFAAWTGALVPSIGL